MADKIRLNKFLAERLGVSRREADDLIAENEVLIDERRAVLGDRLLGNETVKVLDNLSGDFVVVPDAVKYVYLALNKPVGYVCSRKRQGDCPTIYELLPKKYRQLKTVGRLDKDSSGIILLTNDGDFAFQMTHPKFVKSKEYLVTLDAPLAPLHQQEISDFGIEIGDGISRLGLERLNDDRTKWRVTMSEGRNRQIRRTFSALGYEVVGLHRIRFGKYELSGLPNGKFIEVTAA